MARVQTAVDGVSMQVEEGKVYGLLGPNGAGRSATLKMITEMLRPKGGHILFDGHPWQHEDLYRIEPLIEQSPLYSNLTARENLRMRTTLLRIPEQRIVSCFSLQMPPMSLLRMPNRMKLRRRGHWCSRLLWAKRRHPDPRWRFRLETTRGALRPARWFRNDPTGLFGTHGQTRKTCCFSASAFSCPSWISRVRAAWCSISGLSCPVVPMSLNMRPRSQRPREAALTWRGLRRLLP